ncbi:MAG: hypothetical protein U9R05_10085 [Chloroflexota bacterium]|nr:hypothetical protein [Chloroflexota bacterium]
MNDNAIKRLGETVQIWGASSGTDDLGNPVKTWDQDKGTFTGVVMRPTANDVLFAGGRLSDTDKKLHAPSAASIATGDRLEIDSVIYDLYGTLPDWQMKLGGTVQHLQIFLKRVV